MADAQASSETMRTYARRYHQEVDAGQLLDQLGSGAGGVGLGQILGQIERRAVIRGVASLDGGHRQTQRNVALAGARRSQELESTVLGDEAHGSPDPG